MKKLILGLSVLLLASACQFGVYTPQDAASRFVDELNYYYDTYPGEKFYLAKRNGHDRYTYIVVYDELTGEYNAYNLQYYYPGMTFDQYLNQADYDDIYYDLDPLGNNYYEGWDGTIFENTQTTSKDLEKMGAFKQEKKVMKHGEILASKFGLSESRGIQVARLAQQWSALSKKRSMTEADADAFSEELLGVGLSKAMKAYKKSTEGSDSEFKQLMEKAAEVNGTTPEHMNELMQEFIKN